MQAAGLCDIDIKRLSNTMLRKTPCLKYLNNDWKKKIIKLKELKPLIKFLMGGNLWIIA